MTAAPAIALIDCHPPAEDVRGEVLAGLGATPKTLPCKYFYDEAGSLLFERICALDAYYPTRTELAIMDQHAAAMAAAIGPAALLIEFGSGSSLKTRLLLDELLDPAAYIPLDISREHLREAAAQLAAAYPGLRVVPVCADYTADVALPRLEPPSRRRVAYFPGSTIGNFTPAAARAFLARIARMVGAGGGLLIGVDLKKERAVLERAYDDPEGVTAAFNKNLLVRINRELGADFDLPRWRHRAHYNAACGRIEMHLVSAVAQTVHVAGTAIAVAAGETIHTENSYKYSLPETAALAADAGFAVERVWTDARGWFSVQFWTAGA